MLKDDKGDWVEILEITEEVWKKCIQETLQGVLELLESAEKLLDNGGNEAICTGLYTYAVEEYGKILLLKQYTPSKGKVQVKYKKEFRNHTKKFEIAIKTLPSECTTLHEGAFDETVFDPEFFDVKSVADWEARMAVFYCDFSNSGDSIKPIPTVDRKLLKDALSKLREIAFAINTDI